MKQKRILLLISVLLFCVTTVNSASGEAVYYERDGIRYYRWSTWDYVQTTEKENGYYSGEITVPPEITVGRKTYPVKGIHGFQNCANLTKINIPSSVEWIGEFYGCTSLPEIIIPSSVKNIYGNKAFQGCINLKHVVLGDGLKEIPAFCFEDCSKLDKIDIPSNIVTIGGYAFAGCVSLGEVNFDKNSKLSKIDNNAFEKCVNLPSMVIPNAIKTIDDKAFFGCTNLESLTIGSGLEKMGVSAFEGCKKLTSVTIIDGVAEIGNCAFRGCVSLPEIGVPNSVRSIGAGAFENCSGLVKAFIGKNVEEIGSRAFQECGNLLEIEIPNSVTDLGAEAFRGCSSLAHAKLGDGIKIIKESTFGSCSSLQEIVIPDNVTKVDKYSFLGCSSLTAVGIGSGVQELGYGAFYNCSNLPKIKIPYNVVTIGTSCFAGCVNLRELSLFTKNVKNWFAGFESIIDIYIGKTVESLDESAFKECKKLERVSFDENSNLKVIEKYAFYKCYFLKKAILPESVTSIGEAAFQECKAMKVLSLPSTLNSIEKYAFWGCESLDSISAYMPTPFVINENVFSSKTYSNAVLYVDKNEDKYRETFAWSKFFHIVKIGDEPSEGDGGKESDNYKKGGGGGGGTTISVRTYNYDITAKGKGDVVIDKKEESTGNDKGWTSAFDGLKLRDEQRMVEIAHYPDSGVPFKFIPDQGYVVKQVQFSSEKDGALKDVTSEIVYNESISGYTYKAFDKDTSAKLVVTFEAATNPNPGSEPLAVGTKLNTQMNGVAATFVVNGNKTVTLSQVANVSRVKVPSTITYEGVDYTVTEIVGAATGNVYQPNEAVFGFKVEEVVIPNTVTAIGACAFSDCSKLKSVSIPSSVTSIGDDAFIGCSSLTSVTLPSNLKTIGEYAFSGCSLSAVTIPTSVTKIGFGAFQIEDIKVSTSDLTAFAKITPVEDRDTRTFGSFYPSWKLYVNGNEVTALSIPESVTSVNAIFAYCKSLTSVTLHKNVKEISAAAFVGCGNINKVVSQRETPANISGAARFDNAVLKSATLYVPKGTMAAYKSAGWNFTNIKEEGGGEEPAGLKVGDVFGMKGVPGTYRVTSANTVALCKWSNADGKSASIPTSVTYSDGTVYSVTSIGGNETGDPGKPYFPVFVGDVESIAIPATITELGGCMAYGAINLTSISIPATVTSIGQYAFAYSGLTSVTVEHASPLSISENTFEGVYEDATLTVPAGKVSDYKNTAGWKNFKTIKDVNGNTGEKPDQPSAGSITFADAKVERICLENWDKNGDGKLSKEEAAAVKSLGGVFNANEYNGGREEAGGITSFNELQYFTGLESIGRGDFDFQLSLTAVVIPANVQTIEKRAFFCCEKLTSVQIPGGVSYIGQDAFNSCGLKSITIPANVKTLGTKAFAYTNLEHVYVEATTPPEIEKDGALQEAFISNDDWIYKNAVLHVPTGSESLYKVAPGWKQFWTHSSGTAIDGVVPDGEPFDVYDLQGRKVCSGVTSLEGLPKGVYIVKGRKIIK